MSDRLAPLVPAIVGLTTLVAVATVRMDETWSEEGLLVLAAIPTALVLGAVLGTGRIGRSPARGTSVAIIAGLLLLALTIAWLGAVLGGNASDETRVLTWNFALFSASAGAVATRTGSAFGWFFAALGATATVVAGVDWAFSPDGADAARATLLVAFAGLHALGLAEGDRRGELLVAASGVVAVVFAAFFAGGILLFTFGQESTLGWGWELALLAMGAAVLRYAVAHRSHGPAYLGVAILALFALSAGLPSTEITVIQEDGTSESFEDAASPQGDLLGWPLALVALTAVAAAGGLMTTDRDRDRS